MRTDVTMSEVHGALALILRASRLFGMAPIRMERVRSGWMIDVSRAFTVYSYFLIIVLHVTVATSIAVDMMLDPSQAVFAQTVMSRLVVPFEALFITGTITVALYQAPRKMEKIIMSLNKLQEIHVHLKKHTDATTDRNRYFSAVLIMLLACYPTFQFLYSNLSIALREGRNLTVVCLSTVLFIELFMIILVALQFLFMAMNVKSTFEAINDKFHELIIDIDKRILISSASPKVNELIRYLSHSFGTVCDVMGDVDSCFGLTLLMTVSTLILLMVAVPYYIFDDLRSDITNTTDIVLRAGTFMAYVVYVAIVCEPGYRTEKEIDRTRCLVGQLIRKVSESPNKDLALELDFMFKQIKSNYNLSYSPKDMCTLNRSLTGGVIDIAFTLTIMVMQYQALENHRTGTKS